MPDLDIETVIDKLLVFMVDEMEAQGSTPSTTEYDFEPDGEDRKAFIANVPEIDPFLVAAMNVCISRGLLEHMALGSGYGCLGLTRTGHARALSVKFKKPDQPAQPTFHIGAITAHAPMQIGNGNTMSIDAFYTAAISRIDAADAPPDQKAEAKSLLGQMFEHPLLCSVLGGLAGGLAI